jgi:hypothetical protein
MPEVSALSIAYGVTCWPAVRGAADTVSFREAIGVLQMTRKKFGQFSVSHHIPGLLDVVLEVILSWLSPVYYQCHFGP